MTIDRSKEATSFTGSEIETYWVNSDFLKKSCPDFSIPKIIDTCLKNQTDCLDKKLPPLKKTIRWIKDYESEFVNKKNTNLPGLKVFASIVRNLLKLEEEKGSKEPLERRINLPIDFEVMMALNNIIKTYLEIPVILADCRYQESIYSNYLSFAAHFPDQRAWIQFSTLPAPLRILKEG